MRGKATTAVLSGALLMVGALVAGCSAAGPNAQDRQLRPPAGLDCAVRHGSYGITNLVAGAGGQACELRNIVLGPAAKGDYSFGDVVSVKAFAPVEKVAPAKAFDTLDQAARYASEGSEFANVQRMLMSLEIKN